jgi:hypothetical protein
MQIFLVSFAAMGPFNNVQKTELYQLQGLINLFLSSTSPDSSLIKRINIAWK